MDINGHIKELLLLHDCVIIPSWGGFVAQPVPATLDRDMRRISPPSKSISFNRQLQRNDGLLVNHIALKERCSYQDASEKVQRFVSSCMRMLESNGVVSFPGIGKVYMSEEETISFVGERRENYLLDAFGLKPITLPRRPVKVKEEAAVVLAEEKQPVKAIEVKEEKAIILENRDADTKDRRAAREKRKTKQTKWPMAIPIVAIIALVGLMTTGQSPEGMQMHNLSFINLSWDKPINKAEEKPVTLREVETKRDMVVTKTKPQQDPREILEDVLYVDDPIVPQGYYVVLASFSTMANAKKYRQELEGMGYDPNTIHAPESPYRVGIFAGTEDQQAIDMLQDFRSNFNPAAWLVHNR